MRGIPDRLEKEQDPLIRAWFVLKTVASNVVAVWSVLASIALSVVGMLLFLGLSYLLYQAVTSSAIEVTPISVPKDSANKGYTSEAVTLELREALLDLVKEAATFKRTANIVSQKDEPTIALPQTGMSIDTIAAQIRAHFGFGDSWRVSGTIETDGTLYKLNLSLDSDYTYRKVIISKNVDEFDKLFSIAAENIFDEIDPYIVAASFSENDPNESMRLTQKIISSSPGDKSNLAWAHLLRSNIQIKMKNFKEAEQEAEASIVLLPRMEFAYVNLGLALDGQGDVESAKKEYDKAIAMNSRDYAARADLGNALVKLHEHNKAIDEYRRSIELYPRDVATHNNLGNELLNYEGKPDAAIEEFNTAIAIDPRNAHVHNNLGAALDKLGKLYEAMEEYKKAIAIDPRYARAHNNLGNALKSRGEINAAIDEYDEAVSIEPDNSTYLDAQKDALAERDRRLRIAAQEPSETADANLPQPP